MNHSVTTVGRQALCIALGLAGLAAAGAATAQNSGRDYTAPARPYSDPNRGPENPTTAPAYPSNAPPPGYAPGPRTNAPSASGITVYGGPRLSQSVSYTDLDLATDEGAAELRRRVDQTVEDVCARLGEQPEFQVQDNKSVATTCQESARNSAFSQVRDAIDAARYRARR